MWGRTQNWKTKAKDNDDRTGRSTTIFSMEDQVREVPLGPNAGADVDPTVKDEA